MKKTFLFLAINFIGFNCFAQWNTGSNLTYTTSPVVSIGSSTIQGSYGNPPTGSILEIVSQGTAGYSSFLALKSGTKSVTFGSGYYGNALYISANDPFSFSYGATSVMKINPITASNPTGSLAIGTSLSPAGYKLAVGGKIIAEELKVQLQGQWPDYVFDKKYTLPTLTEVEKHIQEKGHLINVPSACEVELNGIQVGEMAKIQQEKIEELTLYIIEQNKINEKQASQLQEQAKQIESLKVLVNKLIEKK